MHRKRDEIVWSLMRSPTTRPRTKVEPDAAQARPIPDAAPLDDDADGTDVGRGGFVRTVKRAARAAVDDEITDAAAAIAYYAFLAIPALLLISVGVFSIFASPSAIDTIIERLGSVMPAEAVALLESGLRRTAEGGGGLTMIVIGGAVAVWTASGA